MPNIFIYWLEGRKKQQKAKIVEGFTKVMEEQGIDRESVSIGFIESSPDNFGKAGQLWSERVAPKS